MWVDENEMVETLALRQHRSRQRPTLQGGAQLKHFIEAWTRK